MQISDFIEEDSFFTTSFDQYLDRAKRGSMFRSDTRQKNPSLHVAPFSKRRQNASPPPGDLGELGPREMVALIRTLSIW